MSSREIAELVQSRHDSVKRTIDRCVESGAIVQPPLVDEQSQDAMGRPRVTQVYNLDKRSSLIVVAQLCPEYTARIVDRWQELEAQVAQPTFAIPQNLSEALRLAADLADENTELRSENTQLKAQMSRPAPAALSHAATLLEKTARSLRGAGVPKRKALGQALDLVHGQTGINLLPNYSTTQDNVSLVVKIVGNAKKYSKDSKYGEFCANGIMPKNKLMGLSKLPVVEMNEAVNKAIELGLLDPCTYQHDKTAFMVRH